MGGIWATPHMFDIIRNAHGFELPSELHTIVSTHSRGCTKHLENLFLYSVSDSLAGFVWDGADYYKLAETTDCDK